MKKETRKSLSIAICMLTAFILWTVVLKFIDVDVIGPYESTVGFSSVNRLVHSLTGVNFSLYIITDWLSLVPVAFVAVFALLGLFQWIKRKSILKIDYSILVLGGFYVVVMLAYIFFEVFVVNYRPVLINGCLEASYPSSTTMLIMCVMPTTLMQFNARIKSNALKRSVAYTIVAFITFMIICRFLSGVHWFTDIIGGALLSTGLVFAYNTVVSLRS